MKKLTTALVMFLTLFCSIAFAASSPIPMLKSTSDNIINTLEKNKSSLSANPTIVYGAVRKYLLPQVDVTGMSRSVLGRNAWKKASKSERSAFTKAFTNLVIRTYASPLAQYSNETIKFLPIRGAVDKRFIRVNSIIVRSNGKNIPLAYSLVSKNGAWKIYDLSVEGVSLLQSFRSQFAQVLQNSDMQSLIKQMKNKSKVGG
jgi:phospholipid transport system substrate-binding protein